MNSQRLIKPASALLLLFSLSICMLGPGCASLGVSQPQLHEMESTVTHKVNVGINAEQAAELMSSIGYTCLWEEKATLRYSSDKTSSEKITLKNVDYWHCTLNQQRGWVTSTSIFYLLVEDGKVSNIINNRAYVGP